MQPLLMTLEESRRIAADRYPTRDEEERTSKAYVRARELVEELEGIQEEVEAGGTCVSECSLHSVGRGYITLFKSALARHG